MAAGSERPDWRGSLPQLVVAAISAGLLLSTWIAVTVILVWIVLGT